VPGESASNGAAEEALKELAQAAVERRVVVRAAAVVRKERR
jgi:hypothetical protein